MRKYEDVEYEEIVKACEEEIDGWFPDGLGDPRFSSWDEVIYDIVKSLERGETMDLDWYGIDTGIVIDFIEEEFDIKIERDSQEEYDILEIYGEELEEATWKEYEYLGLCAIEENKYGERVNFFSELETVEGTKISGEELGEQYTAWYQQARTEDGEVLWLTATRWAGDPHIYVVTDSQKIAELEKEIAET